ncbi:MAG: rod shape-determining protein RodA, partial [Pseudomonadota bacterium]|nr:rod shape-determining protein RodA [Pseudomonadota bacterium]
MNHSLISDRPQRQSWQPGRLFQLLHIDAMLLFGLLLLLGVGLMMLYSAGGQDSGLIIRQLVRLGVAMGAMLVVAQI